MPKPIQCSKCKRKYVFRHKEVDRGHGITEVGIECPHCHNWTHIAYLNKELIRAQQTKRLDGYHERFEAFQVEAKAILEKWTVTFLEDFYQAQAQPDLTFSKVDPGTKNVSQNTFFGTNFENVELKPTQTKDGVIWHGISSHTRTVLWWVEK